jgi:hypothetical protein
MKPSRTFLSSRFSTARHLFHFFSIQQLIVHDTSPSPGEETVLSRHIDSDLDQEANAINLGRLR